MPNQVCRCQFYVATCDKSCPFLLEQSGNNEEVSSVDNRQFYFSFFEVEIYRLFSFLQSFGRSEILHHCMTHLCVKNKRAKKQVNGSFEIEERMQFVLV